MANGAPGSAFDELAAIGPQPIWAGVTARAVHGRRVTLSVIELEAGAVIPEHAHENEQVGIVLSGSMRFRIADEERIVRPGATWSIAPNVPHAVEVGPDGCIVVEVFAQRRDDWDSIAADEPREPRWPTG
jgi:quercetin dioxygenase-like cupin family protein